MQCRVRGLIKGQIEFLAGELGDGRMTAKVSPIGIGKEIKQQGLLFLGCSVARVRQRWERNGSIPIAPFGQLIRSLLVEERLIGLGWSALPLQIVVEYRTHAVRLGEGASRA